MLGSLEIYSEIIKPLYPTSLINGKRTKKDMILYISRLESLIVGLISGAEFNKELLKTLKESYETTRTN